MRVHKSLDAVVVILAVAFETASSYSRIRTRAKRSEESSNDSLDSVGDPLFLTPLLEAGQADSARNQAKVTHPELLGIESYAGYLTVDETLNSNLFFWYFPAKDNSTGAPVVLFLEGGPGTSLFFSLFAQNGPFSVAPNGSLELRHESWNHKHNLIYIDSPVGTGYSFTEFFDGFARTQTQIGDQLRIALQQFFQLFPALRKNDFFVTGTSYAGKFVPAVSYSIHSYNADAEADKKINLKGIAIGNGYTDPINQLAYGQYLHSIGLIDENGRDQFLAVETILQGAMLRGLYATAYDLAVRLVVHPYDALLTKLTGYYFAFNILQTHFGRDPFELFTFVQRPDARLALHVGDIPFQPTSNLVKSYLKEDMTQSHAHLVAFLLDHYPVLIYTGNLDIACNYPGVQKYIENLHWSGAHQLKTAKRQQWRVASHELAGYFRKVGNLTEVLVRNAGHMTSRDQPKWTLELIEKFTGVSTQK